MGFKCPACGLDFMTNKAEWELHVRNCQDGLAKALVSIVEGASNGSVNTKRPEGSKFKIRIDAYYDITCDSCSRSWSTDFDGSAGIMSRSGDGGMGMATSKSLLQKQAYKCGWGCRNGKTLCPECLKTVGNESCNGTTVVGAD